MHLLLGVPHLFLTISTIMAVWEGERHFDLYPCSRHCIHHRYHHHHLLRDTIDANVNITAVNAILIISTIIN